jgi:hypothetical protein
MLRLEVFCSYLSLVTRAHRTCSLEREGSLNRQASSVGVAYRVQLYSPVPPEHCSGLWCGELSKRYQLRRRPMEAITDLLEGQLPKNGGDAAKPLDAPEAQSGDMEREPSMGFISPMPVARRVNGGDQALTNAHLDVTYTMGPLNNISIF